ncbi:MAG: hypothetical protein M3178_11010, partial [Pseudomonadota bacterium]|nr:hypothetical protein [Pseudomonadota bacterium]
MAGFWRAGHADEDDRREDWVLVLAVFDACRSRRGDKGGTTASPELAEGLEALHYFTVHNIT